MKSKSTSQLVAKLAVGIVSMCLADHQSINYGHGILFELPSGWGGTQGVPAVMILTAVSSCSLYISNICM